MTFRPVLWRTFDPDGGVHHYCRKPENVAAEVAWSTPDGRATIHHGDCLEILRGLPDASVNCCVTSPPYWGLRDYGVEGQMGLEPTPQEYVAGMVAVFREVRRVLKDDGTLWLNLGDSYAASTSNNGGYSDKSTLAGFTSPDTKGRRANDSGDARRLTHGLKPKDLVGIPWRVAFALQADGWYLRSDIIWSKPNPMPESVTDRPTKAHEYLFLLSKSERYHYDAESIAEPAESAGKIGGFTPNAAIAAGVKPTGNMIAERGAAYVRKDTRNKRSVWQIPTEPFPGAHFAVMPTALVKPCILAGCPTGGTVLDPFGGSGTVAVVALENGCGFVGCELNPEYVEIAKARIAPVAAQGSLFGGVS